MLSRVLHVFFILLEVVVLFNLLIVVHELGHFLAARWRGLVIEKFGVSAEVIAKRLRVEKLWPPK